MTTINATAKGEYTYDIILKGDAMFRVSAFDMLSAIDLMADYIESHELTNLYIDAYTMKVMAECSKYQTAEAYANAFGLIKCGTNGIYIEITNIKGCPNGQPFSNTQMTKGTNNYEIFY